MQGNHYIKQCVINITKYGKRIEGDLCIFRTERALPFNARPNSKQFGQNRSKQFEVNSRTSAMHFGNRSAWSGECKAALSLLGEEFTGPADKGWDDVRKGCFISKRSQQVCIQAAIVPVGIFRISKRFFIMLLFDKFMERCA